jgi:hypothetical protein
LLDTSVDRSVAAYRPGVLALSCVF